MTSLIEQRIAAARAGANPTVIARLPSGWAVLGDAQWLTGYALLLADPVVPSLNALAGSARATFLADMARLGDAVLRVTGCLRVNYEILGNLDPVLHAHVFPRYAHEPEALRVAPVWHYPEADRAAVPFDPAQHADLRRQLAQALTLP